MSDLSTIVEMPGHDINKPAIIKAIKFDEGYFLLKGQHYKNDSYYVDTDRSIYFLPLDGQIAYETKTSVSPLSTENVTVYRLNTEAPTYKNYLFSYQTENNHFVSAELRMDFTHSVGKIMPADVFSNAIKRGELKLQGEEFPASIIRAVKLDEERLAVLVSTGAAFSDTSRGRYMLYTGKAGNMVKVPLDSIWYRGFEFGGKTKEGNSFHLPNPGSAKTAILGEAWKVSNQPSYNGKKCSYLDHNRITLQGLGIKTRKPMPILDPFHPALQRRPKPWV